MDPTLPKKHTTTKSNPIITTSTAKPHPTPPDPIVSPSSTTILNISNHFAELYANHKIFASLKGSTGNSISRNEKGLNSRALDSSCIALTKSNSQHGRIHGPPAAGATDLRKESNCTRTKVKEKDNKYYSVVNVNKSHQEEVDVEKALLAREKFNEVKKSSAAAAQKEDEKKKTKEIYDEKDVKKASSLMSKSLELEKFNEASEMKRASVSLALNGGGRRKSFYCSETELAEFLSRTGVKIVAVDMPPFMQIHAVDCARKACDSLEKFTSKTLAFTLKKEFDGVYGPAWHCIVGTSFGSFVTHSVGGFMYFSMDHKLYILLFKTTVQRAD
ncbi:hypothetical protein ACH5RR_025952 [Cinchona calisaya]|uniref:Dynein light chain n=1 Tax=Cinchona calisaya TaxID=153742 RepID=A0ABD2Z4H5_9GENT